MLVIVLLQYTVPLEIVVEHTPDHRAYLATLHERGLLVASGPFVPRTGGALLFRVASTEELETLLDGDPFRQRKIAEYTSREWGVTIGAELFAVGPKAS